MTLSLLSATSVQFKEQFNSPIIKGYTLCLISHNKCALVWEGSSCPVSVLVHLAMKHVLQVVVRLEFILWVSFDAMPPYGSSGS